MRFKGVNKIKEKFIKSKQSVEFYKKLKKDLYFDKRKWDNEVQKP